MDLNVLENFSELAIERPNLEVYRVKQFQSPHWREAYRILSSFNPEKDPYCTRIPYSNGGEMYIFYTSDHSKKNDYTTDHFQWRNNGSHKKCFVEENKIKILRSYYRGINKHKKQGKNFK